VGPRAGLDTVEKKQFPAPAGTRTPDHPVNITLSLFNGVLQPQRQIRWEMFINGEWVRVWSLNVILEQYITIGHDRFLPIHNLRSLYNSKIYS
jgi:hypothetical protein